MLSLSLGRGWGWGDMGVRSELNSGCWRGGTLFQASTVCVLSSGGSPLVSRVRLGDGGGFLMIRFSKRLNFYPSRPSFPNFGPVTLSCKARRPAFQHRDLERVGSLETQLDRAKGWVGASHPSPRPQAWLGPCSPWGLCDLCPGQGRCHRPRHSPHQLLPACCEQRI